MRCFFLVALLAVTPVFCSPLQAQVIEDTQIDSNVDSTGLNFLVSVLQTPDNLPALADPTGIMVTPDLGLIDIVGATTTLSFENFAVDEGSDWYAVDPNDVFTASTIANGDFPFLIGEASGSLGELEVAVGESFFLGVNTGNFDSPNGPREDFGWGEFIYDTFGQLRVLDSAVAYDRGGIIVGTSQSVPEPSSAAVLFLIAAGSLCLRRRGN